MYIALEIITVMLAAVTMSLALAHALEPPGKMRLTKEEYLAVQAIYYPGFTLGGIAEFGSIIAALALLILTLTTTMAGRGGSRRFDRGADYILDHDPTREQVLAAEYEAVSRRHALLRKRQRCASGGLDRDARPLGTLACSPSYCFGVSFVAFDLGRCSVGHAPSRRCLGG